MAGSTRQLGLELEPAARADVRAGPELFTVGHSNRDGDALAALLVRHRIAHLADIRAMPYSRRHPQFGREALAALLAQAGIGYSHWPALGGRRLARPDSVNLGLPGAFRGFADHMASAEFAQAIGELAGRAAQARLALMCAEADPANCHRHLIADHCVGQGWRVFHLRDATAAVAHAPSPEARSVAGVVTYPPRMTR